MIKIRAEKVNWSPDVELLVIDWQGAFGNRKVSNIEFEKLEDGVLMEPSFRLSYDDAQSLMDDLWQCGLRPSEGSGSAGALAATQKHLEDMRKIVFDKLSAGKNDS